MPLHLAASFTRERIGFRASFATFVWYPRRGLIEAWLGPLGALCYGGRWYFTRTGQFILSGGIPQSPAPRAAALEQLGNTPKGGSPGEPAL